jgi:hypothetical protein
MCEIEARLQVLRANRRMFVLVLVILVFVT